MENFDLVFKDHIPPESDDGSAAIAQNDDDEEQQKAADWQYWFRQSLVVELAAGDIGRDLFADIDDLIARAVEKSVAQLDDMRGRICRIEGQLSAMTALLGVKADAFGDLRGERGPQGPRGERGQRGPPGRDGRNAPVIKTLTFNSSSASIVVRMSDGSRGPDIRLDSIFGDIKIDRESFSIIVKTISGAELFRLPLRELFEEYDQQRRGM